MQSDNIKISTGTSIKLNLKTVQENNILKKSSSKTQLTIITICLFLD